ncbi:MAG: Nitrilase/cyanide hydratase and apolipoprotein N-acyltransferase [Bacteroidota bacterium]|jgi:predicted amidohydrolase|nr:Nitrilase/cyanide hydratase and apolipoprotein N-acyltransferase [Bacteroidota bacterium]
MQDLNITLIQTSLQWESPEKNLAQFDQLLHTISVETDIIVLPEMFTTGFTMNPGKLAEEPGGLGLRWMQKTASGKNCVVTGSIAVRENHKFYNRLYWVTPKGDFQYYDKRHLFRMGSEHEHYSAGTEKLIVDYKGWKICPLVCYDLRFPVWSRNEHAKPYDVLLYVANWPEARNYPWKQLLIARAIENQSYVAGVNRVGEDGNGKSHSGDSCILNARGEILCSFAPHEKGVKSFSLNYNELQTFRSEFPVLLDGDSFTILT